MAEKDDRPYIRVHDGLPDHPKVGVLSDAGFRLLVASWCHCSRYLTDGKIPAAIWQRMGPQRARGELLDSGLAVMAGDVVEMHDYLKHQRSAAEVVELKEKRREAGSRGGKAKASATASATASAIASARPLAKQTVKQNGSKHLAETEEVLPRTTSSGADLVVAAYIEASEKSGRGRPTRTLVGKVSSSVKRILEHDSIPMERLIAAARSMGAHGWSNLDVELTRPANLPAAVNGWDV